MAEGVSPVLVLLLLLSLTATAVQSRQRLSRAQQAAARSDSCQPHIPACAARSCPTPILLAKETVICPRCMPGYVPVWGRDGVSAIQCGKHLGSSVVQSLLVAALQAEANCNFSKVHAQQQCNCPSAAYCVRVDPGVPIQHYTQSL
jgi:hypothetical protein